MEQVQYNLLFRWFIGLSMDDKVWVPTVFTKNRQHLIEHGAVRALFEQVLATGRVKKLAVQRTLQCGRHAHPGLGQPQELRAER